MVEQFLALQVRQKVILTRLICSGISIIACWMIISFYFILCCQLQICKKRKKHSSLTQSINKQEEVPDKGGKYKSNHSKSSLGGKRMGLGNHLMLCLVISNLGWSACSFLGIEHLDGFVNADEKTDIVCIVQAIFQNFFDISAVCWTTMISRIILKATQGSLMDLTNLTKELLLDGLYSYILPFFLSIAPYFTNSYGPAETYCSIDIITMDWSIYFWTVIMYAFTWGNIIYNIYALISASRFYSRRTKEIKDDKEKDKEVKFLVRYVFILRLFPFIMMTSRIPKTVSRLYAIFTNENNPILAYMYTVTFALTGLLNSILCSYFFRSIFSCCKKKEDLENKENEQLRNDEIEGSLNAADN